MKDNIIDVQLYSTNDSKHNKFKLWVNKNKRKIIFFGALGGSIFTIAVGSAIKSKLPGEDNSPGNIAPISGTPAPTKTPTIVVAPEPSVAPTVAASPEPSVVPTVVASPEPSVAPTVVASPEPSVAPTVVASPESSVAPTVAASHEPSVAPTVAASPEPSVVPTVAASHEPSVAPTPAGEDVNSEEYKKKAAKELYKVGKEIDCIFSAYWIDDIYLNYQVAHPEFSAQDVIIYVNMGLIKPFYSFAVQENDFYGCDILINKYHMLYDHTYGSEFNITKLDEVNNTGYKLRNDASTACEKMIKAAANSDVNLELTSGFVSYGDQEKVYNSTVEKMGKEKAELIVERPGHSYAQIGTKVTFNKNSDAIKWLHENAYKYGWVYVAPKGKEFETGYTYDSTSLHYVGIEIAKEVHDSGLSFDYLYHLKLYPGAITRGDDVVAAIGNDYEYVYNPSVSVEENVETLLDVVDFVNESNNNFGKSMIKNDNHGIHV